MLNLPHQLPNHYAKDSPMTCSQCGGKLKSLGKRRFFRRQCQICKAIFKHDGPLITKGHAR